MIKQVIIVKSVRIKDILNAKSITKVNLDLPWLKK